MYFVGCGVSRLARYNVTAADLAAETGKVRYFEGTPIPTSVVPLGLLMAAFHQGSLYPVRVLGAEIHLVVLLFLLSGQPDDQQDPQDSQAVGGLRPSDASRTSMRRRSRVDGGRLCSVLRSGDARTFGARRPGALACSSARRRRLAPTGRARGF